MSEKSPEWVRLLVKSKGPTNAAERKYHLQNMLFCQHPQGAIKHMELFLERVLSNSTLI
jgi:hypothetical protein